MFLGLKITTSQSTLQDPCTSVNHNLYIHQETLMCFVLSLFSAAVHTLHCFSSHASSHRPKYCCYFLNHTNLGFHFTEVPFNQWLVWPIEVPLTLIDCACASPGVKSFQLVVPRQVLKISAAKSVCTLKRQCFICKLNCTKTYSTQTVGRCSNTERNFLFIFQAGNLDCYETSHSCEAILLFKTKTKIT